MSTYENAPATKLLAVYCACCSRPLVDATSVETGIGPECRQKHGFAKLDLAPDFAASNAALTDAALDGLPDAPSSAANLSDEDAARRLANIFVHRIAVEQDGAVVLSYTNAIRALGYVKLADRIAKRVAKVTIVRDGDELIVKAPYSEESITEMRRVPGRRWDKESKANRFPAASARALWAALERLYMGQTVNGPKGLFTVGAVA